MVHPTDLWMAWRGRRAALRAVRPLVERTRWRRGSDPGQAWMEPYALGFLTSLITLVARPLMGRARGELLGHVQMEAWQALTGLPTDLVGERVLGLSLSQDPDFAAGIRNALAFHAAGGGETGPRDAPIPAAMPADGLSGQTGREPILDLWDQLIGHRLEAGSSATGSS